MTRIPYLKPVAISACIASILLMIAGNILSPSFVARYLSSDGVLERYTIDRILRFQLSALTFGFLVGLGSLWVYNRKWARLLCVPWLLAYALLVYTSYLDKIYPTNILSQPRELVKVARILIGLDLPLTAYEPKTLLRLETHEVIRPKYPAINVHAHFTYWLEKLTPEEIITIMDNSGIEKIVNLDGAPQEVFEKNLEQAKKYPDRIILFYHIWFPDGMVNDAFFSESPVKLEEAVRLGARGLKIWKNLGLKTKDASEKLIPVDDPRLDPIWSKAGQLQIPVLIHVVDPDAFFVRSDRYNERFEQIQFNPQWEFSDAGLATKSKVIAQFENVVRKHAGTTFIAAHLLMLAENLGLLGTLLDKYPNLYVDMSAQVADLGRQPYTARRFFIKYQDRILFGTDGNPREKEYRTHYRFLETFDEYFDYPFAGVHSFGRWKIHGLGLPDEVLEKVYYKNAAKVLRIEKR